jgi:hypothetical protein
MFFVSNLSSSSQAGRRGHSPEHHFEHYSRLLEISGWKLGVLYRQKEANKNAMVFVVNRKPFWEAGILPLNYSRSPEL